MAEIGDFPLPTEKPEVQNDGELNELQKVGAIYSNEFFIGLLENNSLFRITFCERNIDTKELNQRCSLIISRNGLVQLTNMLNSVQEVLSNYDKNMMEMLQSIKAPRNTMPK